MINLKIADSPNINTLLTPGQTHLWLVNLPEMSYLEAELQVLDNHEITRGQRFVYDKHRHAFFKSHLFLRGVLSRYLNTPMQDIVYAYHQNGKPYLKDNTLSFNLSHSGDYALLGICLYKPIGVDIEYHQSRDFIGLANYSFSQAEVLSLETLDPDALMRRFYQIWSKKEAYIKYTGLGLKEQLDKFTVEIDTKPASIFKDHQKQPQLLHYFLLNGLYSVAICTEHQFSDLTVIRFNEFTTKITQS